MKKRILIPLMVLLIVSLACQFGVTLPKPPTPVPTEAIPTEEATPAPQDTPTVTATTRPTATPTRPAATEVAPTPIVLPAGGEQPVALTGSFNYSNGFVVETYFVEHAVGLMDLYGFVTRDPDWELPLESQVLGYLQIDTDRKRGNYRLQLPQLPAGTYHDFANGAGGKKPGVQVFTVAYMPNTTGGPFAEGDDRLHGWPNYLASVVTDPGNHDEIVGGKLLVWAPDTQEQFATGFGSDGLLFTADDPLGPLPSGYTVVDLDQKPFELIRSLSPQLPLVEPRDIAIKDFSKQSYTDAFQNMFDFLKRQYAFNGIKGKEPDWETLYADLMPRVKQAEAKKDAAEYFMALQDFTLGFKDGHVGLDGGEAGQTYLSQQLSGGYGFAIRELDDGRAIVVAVNRTGPAQSAGLQVGDELLTFNGDPLKFAIGKVKVVFPQSSDFGLRYEQARILLRATTGSEINITYRDRSGATKSATLKPVNERQSYFATSLFRNFDPIALPVEYRILDSGSGYIRINTNSDDLNLIVRLFERALKIFENEGVDNLIIDMRANTGGTPLGLAGFFTNKEIPLGILQYYNDKSGKFEADREQDTFTPNQNQYRFKKMALLVDQSCYSACEIEAYGFSRLPGMVVFGMYPTGGVEAEVARGQFLLPEGMQAQFPTGRFVLPDGSIFLEGQGVPPTVKVPITKENVLSQEDVVLKAAEDNLR